MKQKVFIVGFQKTGTTSLEQALQLLGYSVYGGDKNLMKYNDTADLKRYIKKTLTDWDAVQDMPWPLFYKELYDVYPDAKYILTIRDTDKWIRSMVTYFASIRFPLHRKIYGVPCAEGYESRYKAFYENNNREILKFFENKSNFLVMETGKNFNYPVLCSFLNIEQVPQDEFPHARNSKKRKLPNYKLYRKLRSLYWNYKKKYE
ncbi:sulfotransferase [Psychroserpens burtonensis]|uniref:Sulfotransferase n=1 Tax=Psychroserpens burtonensis TaxID=49278 RepID=A0A5C7B5R1_9FLAO|nr:sulfotransferase family protein [Psychroserpens burtonensis]TXE17101.1 sulfotransferase [Psychroserpens burtonensis]